MAPQNTNIAPGNTPLDPPSGDAAAVSPNTPPLQKPDIASAHKKGRPRKKAEEKVEIRRLNVELPVHLYGQIRQRASGLRWTLKKVILDALCVYFYEARRAPQTPVGEDVFSDMAQIIRVIVREEKRIDEAMTALRERKAEAALVVLETVLSDIKWEYRTLRRQLALHLSALPKPRNRSPGAGAKNQQKAP